MKWVRFSILCILVCLADRTYAGGDAGSSGVTTTTTYATTTSHNSTGVASSSASSSTSRSGSSWASADFTHEETSEGAAESPSPDEGHSIEYSYTTPATTIETETPSEECTDCTGTTVPTEPHVPTYYPEPPFRGCPTSNYRTANPETCRNPLHASNSTEEVLREYILCGDIQNGASFFAQSDEWFGLTAGLLYPSLVPVCNGDRNCDPDVVAYKVITKAALDTGNFFKSAFIGVSSRETVKCIAEYGRRLMQNRRRRRNSDRNDKKAKLMQDTMNTHGQEIMQADANEVAQNAGSHQDSVVQDPGRRRLMSMHGGGYGPLVPAICERCWPAKGCFMFDHCPIPDDLDPDLRARAIEFGLA